MPCFMQTIENSGTTHALFKPPNSRVGITRSKVIASFPPSNRCRQPKYYRLPAITVKAGSKTFEPPCVCQKKGNIMYIYELICNIYEDAVIKVPFTAIS